MKSIPVNNHYAIITGASQGLGEAFAYEIAKRGWNLILCALPESGLPEVAEKIRKQYDKDVVIMECDLIDRDQCREFIAMIKDGKHAVNMLINNAGLGGSSHIYDKDMSHWSRMIDLNVHTLFELSYELMPLLKESAPSYMINVSSLSSFYPMPFHAIYSSTKVFNTHFTLAMREEMRSFGINITSLCPSGIYTSQRVIDDVKSQGFSGRLSTFYPTFVVKKALNGVMKNKAIVIPGTFNKILRAVGGLFSKPALSKATGKRWAKTEKNKRVK